MFQVLSLQEESNNFRLHSWLKRTRHCLDPFRRGGVYELVVCPGNKPRPIGTRTDDNSDRAAQAHAAIDEPSARAGCRQQSRGAAPPGSCLDPVRAL